MTPLQGLPYNYAAAIKSKAFSEAPQAITNALNHITWAGKDAIKDGSFKPFNELLCLGYMESQDIKVSPLMVRFPEDSTDTNQYQYHDDGEVDVDGNIVSLSLGGAATMNFRIKFKHWSWPKKGITVGNYDPKAFVQPGSIAWQLRNAANRLHAAGRFADYEKAKKEIFQFVASARKSPPDVLTLELRHGDFVVMNGPHIQRIFEVCTFVVLS